MYEEIDVGHYNDYTNDCNTQMNVMLFMKHARFAYFMNNILISVIAHGHFHAKKGTSYYGNCLRWNKHLNKIL